MMPKLSQSRYLLAAGALAAVLAVPYSVSAAVVPIFSVTPNSVVAGGQGTLHLHLDLLADNGYYNAQFTGGLATLYSGDGGSTSFDIGSGGTGRDFSFDFTYPDPGSYLPSFKVDATYSQLQDAYVQVSTDTYLVFAGYVSCGGFGCRRATYATVNQPVYGWRTFTASGNILLSDSTSLSVEPIINVPVETPLPAALPLFASGFVAMGLIGWSRKRRRARQQAGDPSGARE